MKIQNSILCLIAVVSTMHAVMPIKNNDMQVRNEMNALIEQTNKDINDLEIPKAEADVEHLKGLADKTNDPKLKSEIEKNAKNLEKSVKFQNKHRHMSIVEKNRK